MGDNIFPDFLKYAGTKIEELSKIPKYEELVAKCEGTSNDITDEIFQFWSQNEALSVKIEVNEGHQHPHFNDLIRIVADEKKIAPILVEKDYTMNTHFFEILNRIKENATRC